MANGDDAAAAGIDIVAPSEKVKMGYDEMNRILDELVHRATRHGPDIEVWVQPTAPAHLVGRVWIKTT
jgi:hypothetical protein